MTPAEREAMDEARRVLDSWAAIPSVPEQWRERMGKAADRLEALLGDPPPLTPIPADDVLAWLDETYKPDGRAIWLRQWFTTGDTGREQMTCHSRIDPMGT